MPPEENEIPIISLALNSPHAKSGRNYLLEEYVGFNLHPFSGGLGQRTISLKRWEKRLEIMTNIMCNMLTWAGTSNNSLMIKWRMLVVCQFAQFNS